MSCQEVFRLIRFISLKGVIYLRTWALKSSFCFNRNSFLFQFSKKKHLKKHIIIRTKYEWKCTLRKRCPYLELFWSVFSRIWTEYREKIAFELSIVSTAFELSIAFELCQLPLNSHIVKTFYKTNKNGEWNFRKY